MTTKTELAWAAGFFEGEGCVCLFRGRVRNDGWRSLHIRLSVNQCEIQPIDKLHSMFGGSISFKKSNNERHRSRWEWVASGSEARHAFNTMRPYFVCDAKERKFDQMEREIADNLLDEPPNVQAEARKLAWV